MTVQQPFILRKAGKNSHPVCKPTSKWDEKYCFDKSFCSKTCCCV